MNKLFITKVVVLISYFIIARLEDELGSLFHEFLLFFIVIMMAIAFVIWRWGERETAVLIVLSSVILPFSKSTGILVFSLSFFYTRFFIQPRYGHAIEEQFSKDFGKKADKVKFIYSNPTPHDLRKYGITGNATEVIIWSSDGEIHKGLYDTDNKRLYVREKILTPVYGNTEIPIWGEITSIHDNGTPKKIMYYDTSGWECRVDYFDEKGDRTVESWRRIHDHIEFWNPDDSKWEPVHDVSRFEES